MIQFGLKRVIEAAEAIGRAGAIATLKIYQWVVSPLLLIAIGPACRFEPTCSAYTLSTITEHGIARGGRMGLRRLMRCRPGGGWGYDPPRLSHDSTINEERISRSAQFETGSRSEAGRKGALSET
jgi:putative membrane protein insertion efficiency factor